MRCKVAATVLLTSYAMLGESWALLEVGRSDTSLIMAAERHPLTTDLERALLIEQPRVCGTRSFE